MKDVNYQKQLKILLSDNTDYTYPSSHRIFMVAIETRGY